MTEWFLVRVDSKAKKLLQKYVFLTGTNQQKFLSQIIKKYFEEVEKDERRKKVLCD